MKREQSSGAFLSAVFVDYDNIYLSLKRRSDEAATRFAKDAAVWIKAIETGSLITPTNGPGTGTEGYRRIVMNRCYGNPVPRRNQSDNSTDMSSFPFVRHHFLRGGFEIVDCPPLTAQLKNSSDIRMVMDVRDYLGHATYFDEFVILSGDADFTPLLHRLRAHARRTVIYANDFTAVPYTAISDGEIREADLIALLLDGKVGAEPTPAEIATKPDTAAIEAAKRDILADVVAAVRAAPAPVPLEVLADRAIRGLGHERTVGTSWGGAGGFRELLSQNLPEGMRLSGEPPYVVIDSGRHLIAQPAPVQLAAPAPQPPSEPVELRVEREHPATPAAAPLAQAQPVMPVSHPLPQVQPAAAAPQPEMAPVGRPIPATGREMFAARPAAPAPTAPVASPTARMSQAAAASLNQAPAPVYQPAAPAPQGYAPQQAAAAPQAPYQPPVQSPMQRPMRASEPAQQAPQPTPLQPVVRQADGASAIHQSIARIHEACQAPPLAPPEYRVLFESMAQEINEHGLIGAQTILNIVQRAQERGIDVRRDDVRFVLDVVSEADPWFEQGASANLFAGRFRNYVVARCRSQGLNLSADELDLVEAWFAGNAPAAAVQPQQRPAPSYAAEPPQQQAPRGPAVDPRAAQWSLEEGRQYMAEQRQPLRGAPQQAPSEPGIDDFPRIVRTRLRG